MATYILTLRQHDDNMPLLTEQQSDISNLPDGFVIELNIHHHVFQTTDSINPVLKEISTKLFSQSFNVDRDILLSDEWHNLQLFMSQILSSVPLTINSHGEFSLRVMADFLDNEELKPVHNLDALANVVYLYAWVMVDKWGNDGSSILPFVMDFEVKMVQRKCCVFGSLGQNTCSICLEEYPQGQEVIELSCLHCFHQDCIVRWQGKSSSCPLCRSPC